MKHSGIADLSLHGGRVPAWLTARMVALGSAIGESVDHHGRRGLPARLSDARFSFAHGGKDRHPFRVPVQACDESIRVLRHALAEARLGRSKRLDGLERLDAFTRAIETRRPLVADVAAAISQEREIAPTLGGRTVFADRPRRSGHFAPAGGQLSLFDR